MSVNKVILLGRLTKDPVTKEVNGLHITNFSIATNKQWKNESGEKQEKVEFHNIVCFKKLAEITAKFLVKGKQIFLEGELQTTSWEAEGVKKWKTEIVANTVEFLGSANDSATSDAPVNKTPDEGIFPSPIPAKKPFNHAPGADNEPLPF